MQEQIQSFLDQYFFSDTYQNYFLTLVYFIGIILFFFVLKTIILSRLKKFNETQKSHFYGLVIRIVDSLGFLFYFIFAINLAVRNLNLTNSVLNILNGLTILVLVFYIASKVQEIIFYIIKNFLSKKQSDENGLFDDSLLNFLSLITNITIWIIAIIIILQSFNINIGGLVGGLGITGIAVAFALQNVLSDIFASFSIYFDKPFKIGDFIIVDQDMGVVQKIGIKSTRIKSLSGEMLVFNNKMLSDAKIKNFAEIEKRRREFKLSLTYSTSTKKIKEACDIIEKTIKELEICDFERAVFKDFADSSLDIVCSYIVNTSDLDTFMQINQKINLDIKEKFEQEKIEFAFPTNTIYLSK